MAAATTSMLGKGTILAYSTGDTLPYTYTNLTKVMSVNPTTSVGEVEDVVLDSTFEGYLPTIAAGECTFTIRHRQGDAGVVFIQGLIAIPEVVHWRVTSIDLSTVTFDGFVKGYSTTFENTTIVDAEVPMRITTIPVYTAGV